MTRAIYEEWRRQRWSAEGLRDTPNAAPPPERLLQAVWRHQRLRREALRLADGRPVKILHPGFINREPGPDFRQAVLQLDHDPARVGDVEIDAHAGLWQAHGHHENPGFGKVLLHVVWDGTTAPLAGMPTLALKPHLDAPLTELAEWLSSAEALSDPRGDAGHCSEILATIPEEEVREVIRQAAYTRLRVKAHQFEARARQAGWEQALWEGLFRALGYKNNCWPMQRLAELLPEMAGHAEPRHRLAWQARLLGISGLIADDADEAPPETLKYQVSLWDHWWRERQRWTEAVLPAELWNFSGIRPANHPQRRLALAADWLSREDFFKPLENWFAAGREDLAPSLLEVLAPAPDEFWDRHWTLRSRRMSKPSPMLGLPRVSDLAINVILPWFWMRARACGNPRFQALAERHYFQWPAAEDNTVLRLARRRLFPERERPPARTAAEQQGLLQIVRDWCDHFDATCKLCPWPELLKGAYRV